MICNIFSLLLLRILQNYFEFNRIKAKKLYYNTIHTRGGGNSNVTDSYTHTTHAHRDEIAVF